MPAKWLNKEDAKTFLKEGFYGRLATSTNGYPYITPLNYVYDEDRIFFHSHTDGRKLNNIKENPQVCFEVSQDHKLVKNKKPCAFGVRFSSVLVFGKAKIVEDPEKKMKAVQALISKYAGEMICDGITEDQLAHIAVVEITVEELSGKENVDPEDL